MVELLVYYLIAVNLGGFVAFGLDKEFAETGSWRISETTLLAFAFLGGWLGVLAGRKVFRHKTRKQGFGRVLVRVFAAQMVLVVMLGLFIWNLSTTPGNILFESEEETAARLAIERSVTYEGCNEVRAQGKAPLYRGQPGYGEHMDGDGDGIACEPYR
ncbi:DUF1294 domain-containing protein [Qipengyuania sphaerica]|uniref:DUF1294 domain-containing protein n=1 Tax=Qipengyuania sphaerica TaxID=2867243 RepID=UPI001FFDDEEC|nr:DUF1294 domain-containing protein [Qipengyuania sphaerica]